jgi:hypothetical protein
MAEQEQGALRKKMPGWRICSACGGPMSAEVIGFVSTDLATDDDALSEAGTATDEDPTTGLLTIGAIIDGRMERWWLKGSNFFKDLARAKALLPTDPDMALTKTRQILERCMAELHEKAHGPCGTKPLEQLVRDLSRDGILPRKVLALCEVVRELGNAGAHPICDEEKLTYREGQIALLSLLIVLKWYVCQESGNDDRQD